MKTRGDCGWVRQRAPRVPGISCKGHSGTPALTQMLKRHQGHMGRNSIVFRTRARRAAFSQTEVLTEAIPPLPSPPLSELAGELLIWVSLTWLTLLVPHLGFPDLLPHSNCESTQVLPRGFSKKQPPLAHALDFPKISQTSSIWPLNTPCLLLSGPRPGTSNSQPPFVAWPLPVPRYLQAQHK